jgi:hypothetical protein
VVVDSLNPSLGGLRLTYPDAVVDPALIAKWLALSLEVNYYFRGLLLLVLLLRK